MPNANPTWGSPRIHGELLKLGIKISQRSVARLLPTKRTLPFQTWRTFLDNQVKDLLSIDFLVVPTATFRILFVLVVLAHDRRRVVHFNVTEHPTARWTGEQMIQAFPDGTEPKYLIRDPAGNKASAFHSLLPRTICTPGAPKYRALLTVFWCHLQAFGFEGFLVELTRIELVTS